MLDSTTIHMLVEGTGATLYMTLLSTFFGYVLGLPIGIILTITDKEGIKPNAVVYKILDFIVNILRSIPFLILLILLIPVTRFIVGKSYGVAATVVPLVFAAAPFIGRMVESSLKEVDKGVIEAAQSMGAGTMTIIWKVLLAEARTSLLVGLTIAIGTILGYSAMAGVVGGGGYCDPLRLLPLPDRHHARFDRHSGSARTDSAGNRYDGIQEAGQKTALSTKINMKS